MLMRRLLVTAAIAAVAPALVAIPADAATTQLAATTSSSPTGQDPIAFGCANDATTTNLKKFDGGAGYIELRYSPHCRAAWARITSNIEYIPYEQGSGDVTVHRNSDGKEYSCTLPKNVTHPSCYTKMVNDSGVTSYAKGTLDLGDRFQDLKTSSY